MQRLHLVCTSTPAHIGDPVVCPRHIRRCGGDGTFMCRADGGHPAENLNRSGGCIIQPRR